MNTQLAIKFIGYPKTYATTYPEVRKIVASQGMELPLYKQIDRYFLKKHPGSAAARELLAHPKKDGVFQRGKDIVDSITDLAISASEVPQRAFGKKGIGMIVVPRDGEEGVEITRGRVYIHPQSIAIFNGMIQASGEWAPGKPHRNLGIPVAISPQEFERLPEDMQRWLLRIEDEGVRFLIRRYSSICDRRFVYANYGANRGFSVAGIPIHP